MKKQLKALHLSQWLPLLGIGLVCIISLAVAVAGAGVELDSFPGVLMLLPALLVPAGWVLTLVYTVENMKTALRMLLTADGLKHGTLRFVIRQLPQAVHVLEGGEPDPVVLRTAMRHKLAMIPYFVVSFLLVLVLSGGMLNPWLVWFIPLVIGFGMVFAYLSLLSTSGYVIAQIVLLRRQQKLTQPQSAILIALQLLFVLDIPGCVYLCKRFAPKPPPPSNQS